MKGGGSFLVIVVGILLLAAVLYGKTGCFGGFWNCVFGGNGGAPAGGGTSTTIPPLNATNGVVNKTQTFTLGQLGYGTNGL